LSRESRSAGTRLLDERRVLILADPGAGKTFEALTRARKIHEGGKKAFFVRIEAIDAAFESAFEVGAAEEFVAWLAPDKDAKPMVRMAEATRMIDPPLPIIGSIFCTRNRGALAFRANVRS
jgi:hypothetical protein